MVAVIGPNRVKTNLIDYSMMPYTRIMRNMSTASTCHWRNGIKSDKVLHLHIVHL